MPSGAGGVGNTAPNASETAVSDEPRLELLDRDPDTTTRRLIGLG